MALSAGATPASRRHLPWLYTGAGHTNRVPNMRLMTKALTALTRDDIEELCQIGASEGQFLDFKANLAGKGTAGDAWNQGSNELPDTAVNELAKSIVAFANAEGGWIVLGIRETSKPARAESISPMRACHDLARRLRQSLDARIDPTPTGIETWAVETEPGTDRGVVVLRMPASAYAPHGVIRDRVARVCYEAAMTSAG